MGNFPEIFANEVGCHINFHAVFDTVLKRESILSADGSHTLIQHTGDERVTQCFYIGGVRENAFSMQTFIHNFVCIWAKYLQTRLCVQGGFTFNERNVQSMPDDSVFRLRKQTTRCVLISIRFELLAERDIK